MVHFPVLHPNGDTKVVIILCFSLSFQIFLPHAIAIEYETHSANRDAKLSNNKKVGGNAPK